MTRAAGAAVDMGSTADSSQRPAPFGAPYVFALFVIDGNDPSVVHRLIRPLTVVGRGEESHLSIEDDKVSKAHCTIRVEGPVCSIIDPGSRNGTSVNGRRLAPNVAQRLRNLDEIEIGDQRFLLLTGRYRDQRKNRAL